MVIFLSGRTNTGVEQAASSLFTGLGRRSLPQSTLAAKKLISAFQQRACRKKPLGDALSFLSAPPSCPN
jgi:hypothetical protein